MDKEALIRRLMKTFVGELEEHVQALEENLLILERRPDAASRPEVFRALFRTGHSLKGAARSVNVSVIEVAGHHLESIFAAARDGVIVLGPDQFKLLFATADAIKDAGQRLGAGESMTDSALMALLPKLQAASTGRPSRSLPLGPASQADDGVDLAIPRPTGRTPADEVRTPVARDVFVRIPSTRLDRLLTLGGELRAAGSRTVGRDADLQRLLEMVRRWEAEWRAGERSMQGLRRPTVHEEGPAGAADDSLPAARMLHTGREKLQWLTRQLESLAAGLVADRLALDQVAEPLDREVMRARMVPFAEACEGLERAARDIAQKAGKEVELAIEGGEIEIDRSMVAVIKDALLHLTRNAVDHGIESPAARAAVGKIARGRIALTAALRQERVEIVVADDGRGFDLDAIRAKARSRGLTVPQGEREIARLAFLPGFSTSANLTEISGRGVGLDVVRAAVESQRGSCDVASEAGRGSRILLSVPLTLTRLPALLVTAAAQTYAFDSAVVRGLLRVGASELRPMEGRDVLIFEDKPVTVSRLADILGRQGRGADQIGDKVLVVIVEADGARAGFVVDELLAEKEVVVKDLGARLQRVRNVAGATVLANGRIALILNASDLLRSAIDSRSGHTISTSMTGDSVESKKRLLVVDDSVTTRTLVKSILEASGYNVADAADGLEAWQFLQEKGADLVVSDVEMPRMDGFALTEAIRNSRHLKKLPVILVTGLEKEQDKMRGLDAGADAYLVKSAFDQTNLIRTIQQLL